MREAPRTFGDELVGGEDHVDMEILDIGEADQDAAFAPLLEFKGVSYIHDGAIDVAALDRRDLSGMAPMGAISMPFGPQPCRRDVSLTSQYVNEPAVDTLIFLPLRSATVFGPSGRTTMASNSGGPAMAATPFD
jgi:hypothetical protein